MRECPICHYIESPHWHRHKWRIDVDICHLEDFKEEHPDLAEKLIHGAEAVTDETNAYQIGGRPRDHVFRVWIGLYKAVGRKAFHGMPSEAVHHMGHMHPGQKVLVDNTCIKSEAKP